MSEGAPYDAAARASSAGQKQARSGLMQGRVLFWMSLHPGAALVVTAPAGAEGGKPNAAGLEDARRLNDEVAFCRRLVRRVGHQAYSAEVTEQRPGITS